MSGIIPEVDVNVLQKTQNRISLLNIFSLFDLQLHNVTLALDLLNDTGLQVSSVDPQGDEIKHWSRRTIHTPPCRQQMWLKLKYQAQELKKKTNQKKDKTQKEWR